MKIVQKSNNGKMFKIQDSSFDKDTWFFLTDQVKAFAEKAGIDVGADVDIQTEIKNGSKTIVKITKKGEATSVQSSTASVEKVTGADTSASKTSYSGGSKYNQRDPDTQESIIRQSVMKCAAEAVTACQGMIQPDEIGDKVIEVYRKLLAVVKE